VKGRGYSKGFVPCNARGTNEHMHKSALAFLVNFYINPDLEAFIRHYNTDYDSELYALTILLQWIWRSRIRNGKSIIVYIPSYRMRTLLINWMST